MTIHDPSPPIFSSDEAENEKTPTQLSATRTGKNFAFPAGVSANIDDGMEIYLYYTILSYNDRLIIAGLSAPTTKSLLDNACSAVYSYRSPAKWRSVAHHKSRYCRSEQLEMCIGWNCLSA